MKDVGCKIRVGNNPKSLIQQLLIHGVGYSISMMC